MAVRAEENVDRPIQRDRIIPKISFFLCRFCTATPEQLWRIFVSRFMTVILREPLSPIQS